MPAYEAITVEELRPSDITPAQNHDEKSAAFKAWIGLIMIDTVVRLAGFHRFYQLIRKFPTRPQPPDDEDTIQRICAAVDRAATYYFKRAWCLQRSATAVCLLRRQGVPAELVIGVQKMPFYAHAWVESDGKVLNDHPIVQKKYTVLERC